MNRIKKILIYTALFTAQLTLAQADYTHTTSKDYFQKAYEQLGREEFSEAFTSFEKVDKSDTLYNLAQLSKLIAEYKAGYHKKVIKTAAKMILEESVFSSTAFEYKIKAYIDLKEFVNAEKTIGFGTEKYPLYGFQYEYLRALIFKHQGKYEEAKRLLQSIIIQHPQHSFSHVLLAQLMGEEGGKVQSILGFQMAIISNRNANCIREAFRKMRDIMQGNFEINREKEDAKMFKKINSLISSGLALKGKYKADLPLKSVTNLVTDLIFKTFLEEETSSLTDDSEDFTMKYYAKFLNEVKKKGLEKGYILYVMSVLNNPSIKKMMIAYKNDVEAFEKFKIKYWNNQVNRNKFSVNEQVDERDYILDKMGVLTAFGNRNEENIKVGKWTYLYPTGKTAAETEYNNEGMLTGKNVWYAQEGYIKESGVYKAGELDGFAYFTRENGCSSYEGTFKEGELNGEVKIYNSTGILNVSKNFKDNKVDGLVKEYYKNGRLSSTVNIVKGLREGKLYVFSPKGDTIKTKTFLKGKAVGSSIEYYENGNVVSQGMYKSGKRHGEWRDYYYDGSLAYKYNYKNGGLHGDYLKLDSHGDTMVYKHYNNGLLHGADKDYIQNNKVLWEHVFKNGKLKKYYNYSPDGVLLSKGKKDYLLNDRFGFKYIEGTKKGNTFHGEYIIFWKNGKIKEKRNYAKGILSGESKEYFPWGGLDEEKYYKNDNLHGKYKSYYDNGELYADGQYIDGEKIGLWKFYHPNGNLFKEAYYIGGKSDGHVTFYSISGEKRSNYFYKGEVLYKSEVFDQKGNVVCEIKTPQGNGEYLFKSTGGHLYLKSNLSGGEYHGRKIFYYPNGQIIESVDKNHGESHGRYASYFPDGKIKEMGEYVYGKKKGEWKSYYHNGNLSAKVVYQNDIVKDSIIRYYITGQVKEIAYYDKNGESSGVKYFHSNGALNCFPQTEREFIHGEYSNYDAFGKLAINRVYNGGECVSYNYLKNGKLIEPIIINGNGALKTYYDNGKLATEYTEKDGMCEGPYKRMYSNGKPWVEATYIHDKRNGNYKAYFSDGTLRYEGEYDFGRLNGIQKFYNQQGSLLSEVTFNQGIKEGISKFYDNYGNLLYILLYKDDVVISVDGL